ncbi:uncharacterized protein LOC126741912 [Anthonomus grandis grandis]|uniref:uncharacterized protein LOC126741912 n=1 Tax=Anthonomus grandis grandis TaxID=2921223 RepID=UPI0021651472|nr:uncharacterized protein LOC126741912 [Anthonomus grandis grandis]
MRRGFSKFVDRNWTQEDTEEYSIGDIDLINLRLNLPADSPRNRKIDRGSGDIYNSESKHYNTLERRASQTVSKQRSLQGYETRPLPRQTNLRADADNKVEYLYTRNDDFQKVVVQEPISEDHFLFPTKKKLRGSTASSIQQQVQRRFESIPCSESQLDNSISEFPFKVTPSGNLKVESSQVIFASKKLSVLVADPKNTKVNIHPEPQRIRAKMSREMGQPEPSERQKTPNSPMMESLINHAGGISTLGNLLGGISPVRSPMKEASEYESKETCEILDPELDLGRLGYSSVQEIDWDKAKLPEKKNLYLELYHRITNNTNADCKVYIDNEEFSCHLIVLQCYSELFDAYVAVKKVELPSDKCSVSTFALIYEWMITGEPSYLHLNRGNVLDIFVSARYLRIKDLVEQCWALIDQIDVFNEDTAFLLYMDAKKRNLPEVMELMLPRIQNFFLMLVSSQDWLELDVDDIKNLLSSNYISVNCEMEIFMSAVRWLKHDWQERDKHKYDVLTCVRFGNIAPWQLVDIKRNPENPDFLQLATDQKICKMIDDGLSFVIIKYWYGQEKEDFQYWNTTLGLTEPLARNWAGPDKTYFTFREFLIYLDQYRRSQLIEKNKPKNLDKSDKNKPQETKYTAPKLSPRIPTMDEFMSKKVPPKKLNKIIS